MIRKAIASALLVVIAAWAEMAMAPMLAMHAGHMLPGHETAADMPAAPHAHHHHPEAESQQPQNVSHRPCCPGFHDVRLAIVLEVGSAAPGCDDPHSCCFRQGPQSVPATASSVQSLRRDATPAPAPEAMAACLTVTKTIPGNTVSVSPPPNIFGMILRV